MVRMFDTGAIKYPMLPGTSAFGSCFVFIRYDGEQCGEDVIAFMKNRVPELKASQVRGQNCINIDDYKNAPFIPGGARRHISGPTAIGDDGKRLYIWNHGDHSFEPYMESKQDAA